MSAPVQTNLATQEKDTGFDGSPIQPDALDPGLDQEQEVRSAAYSLLATLLRSVPDQAIIDQLRNLSDFPEQGDDLSISMHMLGLAAKSCNQVSIDDEFHNLFIGLGRGELVPYGSWYLTGFLMEKPLGLLRRDLSELGYERSSDTHEPEDHVAALCEVMSLLIGEGREHEEQRHFFETHMGSWMGQFFNDLSQAKSAVFYRAVGRFGQALIVFEEQYLSMKV
jgi:TorA maturation chaperone TorD